jgi:hypothetical protein
VSPFVRKSLTLDAAKVRELARQRGTSESEAVRQAMDAAFAAEQFKMHRPARQQSRGESEPARQAADYALAAEEVMAAIRELHARGGVDDVFGPPPDEPDD